MESGFEFLFIDEVSITTNIYPNYGYSPKNQKFLVTAPKINHNISMIVAIGFDIIYGYQIFDGSIKAEDFGFFMINILDNHPEIR